MTLLSETNLNINQRVEKLEDKVYEHDRKLNFSEMDLQGYTIPRTARFFNMGRADFVRVYIDTGLIDTYHLGRKVLCWGRDIKKCQDKNTGWWA